MKLNAKARLLTAAGLSNSMAQKFLTELQHKSPFLKGWELVNGKLLFRPKSVDRTDKDYTNQLKKELHRLGWTKVITKNSELTFLRADDTWELGYSQITGILSVVRDAPVDRSPGIPEVMAALKAAGFTHCKVSGGHVVKVTVDYLGKVETEVIAAVLSGLKKVFHSAAITGEKITGLNPSYDGSYFSKIRKGRIEFLFLSNEITNL